MILCQCAHAYIEPMREVLKAPALRKRIYIYRTIYLHCCILQPFIKLKTRIGSWQRLNYNKCSLFCICTKYLLKYSYIYTQLTCFYTGVAYCLLNNSLLEFHIVISWQYHLKIFFFNSYIKFILITGILWLPVLIYYKFICSDIILFDWHLTRINNATR